MMTKASLSTKNPKYLIVGQGLAGTALAHTLHSRRVSFKIVDFKHDKSSSMVASGMFSPIVLKRILKSWNIDHLLPKALDFYIKIEEKIEVKFLKKENQYWKINHDYQKEDWIKKSKTEEYRDYLGEVMLDGFISPNIKTPHGYGKITNAGRVDIPLYLSESRHFFQNILIEEKLNYDDLILGENEVEYLGESFNKVIFCEGFQCLDNPYFQDIILKPVKGENLWVEAPGLNIKEIVKCGIYILPIGNDQYHIGSSYTWGDLSVTPTDNAREWLLQKFEKYTGRQPKVLGQKSGIRPASHDRRPIVGTSKLNNRALIFNGLGSKGVLLSPFSAEKLVDHILDEKPIPEIISTARF